MTRAYEPEAAATVSPAQIACLPYRPGVGIMLLNRSGKVFVARRNDMPSEAWQMPQGGIDEGEPPREAALRELREELGTDKAEIIAERAGWIRYDIPADLIPKLWGGRFRGQRQKWFVLRFLGTDADIDIETAEPEFSAWKWAEMGELPALIVPFKRQVYAQLVAEFGHLAKAAPGG
ncbi:MAG: RNA pyrophosphohydrolase [Kiloniellaceae bacterium]